jgi:hypothetical protein
MAIIVASQEKFNASSSGTDTQTLWITFIESWKNVDVWNNGTHDEHKHVHDITTEGFHFVCSDSPPDHGNT